MTMLAVDTEAYTEVTFNKVLSRMEAQVKSGLQYMGREMVRTAEDSMPFKDGPAPKGKPPHSHTGKLRSSLAFSIDGNNLSFGTLESVVGKRGAWLEFGGRELRPGERGRPRKRKLNPHPFIRPAREAELDKFAPAVAGTLTAPK